MAGRLLVMKNSDAQITGVCEAEGYANYVKLENANFSASASMSPGEQTGEIYQTGIEVMLPMGPWIAELEAALYAGKNLGTLTITELAQSVDTNNAKTWKKVRELTLSDAWIETLTQGWAGIHTTVAATFQYTNIGYTWGDKVASYHRSEKT